jgi:hypothetical protein
MNLQYASLHAIGVNILGDGVHDVFSKLTSRIFWEVTGPKRKYHMVRCALVCRTKVHVGLVLINMKLMSIILMLKWVWRLYNQERMACGWVFLRLNIYNTKIFDQQAPTKISILERHPEIQHLFRLGAKHEAHNGSSTRVWIHRLQGSFPLRDRFGALFAIAAELEASMASAV